MNASDIQRGKKSDNSRAANQLLGLIHMAEGNWDAAAQSFNRIYLADPESAEAVAPLGVDTLDSCNPTRIARHGMLLCKGGAIKIKQGRFADDFGPIDPECATITHSRAYLHHLFKQHEPLFMTLASQHNLIFMNALMADIRQRILRDEL